MSDRTATVITWVVTAVWVGSVIAAIFKVNDYQPPESINGIFALIVGGAFIARRKRDAGDE